MASPGPHDRSEAQSVEIVLALFLAVLACLSVVFVSWLLRVVIGTAGDPAWTVGTAVIAIAAGLGALVRQLLHARRDGL